VTPDAIRERLESLRAASAHWRARPLEARLAPLARVLESWRDARSPWRRELEARLPEATGFAAPAVRAGLELALAGWDGAALRALASRELGAGPAFGFETTSLVLAGSIPMPTLQAMLAPLALGSAVLVKPASRDPVSAELVAGSLADADAELGACVALARVAGSDAAAMQALCEADCVVAYGDDATIAALAARTAPSRRLVAHGHRVSVAALGSEATRGDALRKACAGFAVDVAAWDQLGCLSPIALYVQGDAAAARRTGEALASALREAALRWPRGRVEPAAAAPFANERDAAELRVASGAAISLHTGPPSSDFCIVVESDACLRPAPLHRFVRVHPVADAGALLAALAPLRRHLAGVALAGFGSEQASLVRALAQLGASRVCEPGALQAPPLGWESGGRGVLASLARFPSLGEDAG
jgi:hypothetical protein